MAEIALAAIAHAEGSLHKGLELDGCVAADLLHLLEGGLAGQNNATETYALKELDAGQVGVVGLGTGVQLDGRQVALKQAEVLNNGGIDTCFIELMEHAHSIVHLVVEEEGVDGGEDPGVIDMGIAGQLLDVGKGVDGGRPCPEGRGSDVDGVGTVVDGFDALLAVFGRREEF